MEKLLLLASCILFAWRAQAQQLPHRMRVGLSLDLVGNTLGVKLGSFHQPSMSIGNTYYYPWWAIATLPIAALCFELMALYQALHLVGYSNTLNLKMTMKNRFLSFVFGIVLLMGCGRKSAPTTQGSAKTYAILPFDVAIEKNLQIKKTTPEQLRQMEEREAYQYQNGVFQYMMQRKKDFSVNFQDVDDTNTLLKRNGITYDKGRSMTKAELCQLLQVDGILTGKYQRKENLDRNISRGLDLIARQTENFALSPKQGEANLSLSLYNATEKRVVWTYQNDDWNSSYRSPEEMAQKLMERAAKKFPYKK